MIEEKILNCGESGTTARLSMIPIGTGVAGEGIFVFMGEGGLPKREHRTAVDFINQKAARDLINTGNCLSFAMPANERYHMPVRIYVGTEALKQLVGEIESGKYEYFRHMMFR